MTIVNLTLCMTVIIETLLFSIFLNILQNLFLIHQPNTIFSFVIFVAELKEFFAQYPKTADYQQTEELRNCHVNPTLIHDLRYKRGGRLRQRTQLKSSSSSSSSSFKDWASWPVPVQNSFSETYESIG
jgi:hypothetical protein